MSASAPSRRDSGLSKDIYPSIGTPADTVKKRSEETYHANTAPNNWYTSPYQCQPEYEDKHSKPSHYADDTLRPFEPSSDEHISPAAYPVHTQNNHIPASPTTDVEDIKLTRLWSVYQRARSEFHAVTDAMDRSPNQTSAAARFLRDSAENTLQYLKTSKDTDPIVLAELEGTYRMANDVADSLAGGRKRKFEAVETNSKMKTKIRAGKGVDRRGSSVENRGVRKPVRSDTEVRGAGMSERINDNNRQHHGEERWGQTRGRYDRAEVRDWQGAEPMRADGGPMNGRFIGNKRQHQTRGGYKQGGVSQRRELDRMWSYGNERNDRGWSGNNSTRDLRRSSGPASGHGHSNVPFGYSRRGVDSYQPR